MAARCSVAARLDIRVLLSLVIVGSVLAGCYDPADPNMYPLRLQAERIFSGLAHFADLDGDGHDEVLAIALHAKDEGHVGLLISTLGGQVIEQVNVPEAYRLSTEGRPHTLDLDGDGRLEVILAVVRGDSLFARVYDAEGRYRRQLFLASGEPRALDEGELSWDPAVWGFYLEDLTGDDRPELLTSVRTGYARYPRGLLAHDLTTGQRVGDLLVGANFNTVGISDFDGDGRRELLFAAAASNNGAQAGGFSDDRAYAGVVDLTLPLRVRWSRTADRKRYPALRIAPLGSPGANVIVAETVGSARPGPSVLRVVNLATGEVARSIRWPNGIDQLDVGMGPAGEPRIYITDLNQRTTAMTPSLEVVAQRTWARQVRPGFTMDLDDDGVDELAGSIAGGHFLWLAPDLSVRAVAAGGNIHFGRAQRAPGQQPLVFGRHLNRNGDEPQTMLYRVEANPWWWWHRYGLDALAGLGGVLMFGLGFAGARHLHRRHVIEAVYGRALASDERGLVVLKPDGTVAETNPAFRRRLRLDGEGGPDLRRALAERAPELEGFLAALPESPAHRREGIIAWDDAPAWVVAEPLEIERGGRPYWLVAVTSPPVAEADGLMDGTWPLLARRVVHDLKNPLTSILLTMQRMQMEAHAHASEDVAARLDPYVERVEGRVEHLRRMAQNLLKFLDAAAPELAEVDLCDVVERAVDELRPAMPPDVQLDLRRCSEPVPTRADAEQVASALENLVMNAVQAMTDGGRVTVQARVARRLQPEGAPAPRDYAVLEVLDTGRGMDDEARRRAFEPGFTTRSEGTGLGLALVRKVVRDHGGFAEVQSEPGTGTAVCLHLPLLSDADRSSQLSDEQAPPRNAAAA